MSARNRAWLPAAVAVFAAWLAQDPAPPSSSPPAKPRTVVLVRHAEKADASADPALSEAGRARAERLAALLANARVERIFVSKFVRTQATVAPLAAALRIVPEVVAAADHDAIVTACETAPPGSVTLVCTHSNVLPKLAKALGVAPTRLDAKGHVPEGDYGRVYVITLPPTGAPGQPAMLELAY
jgi:phosphohistidine phosphatase SixA